MTSRIHHLDDVVVRQIAAGEVIERPASVVKEAVENALDAGATEVQVEVREGGHQLIQVADNGSGMTSEDLTVCADRHSTSKIATEVDLTRIVTLGFRGEFLASLVAVAEVTILSRLTGSSEAYQATYTRLPPEVRPGSRGSPGTTLTVRNLFGKVPARRKFLAKPRTDAARVHEVVRQFALAWPSVRFSYYQDGKEVLRTQPGGPLNAVALVLGRPVTKNLLPVEGRSDDGLWEVTGFVGKPVEVRANRSSQYFVLNRRVVEGDVLREALEDGFGSYLASRRFPVAVLYLTGPTEDFDPNVHPAKKEVRFRDRRVVYDLVREAVGEALRQGLGTSAVTSVPAPTLRQASLDGHVSPPSPGPVRSGQSSGETPATTSSAVDGPAIEGGFEDDFGLEEQVYTPDQPDRPVVVGEEVVEDPLAHLISETDRRKTKGGNLHFEHVTNKDEVADLVPLIQYRKTFVLATSPSNPEFLYVLDQHAVAERVTLERLLAKRYRFHRQQLLQPIRLPLSPVEEEAVEDALDGLGRLGYRATVEDGELVVQALPVFFGRKIDRERVVANVRGIVDDLVKGLHPATEHSTAELEVAKSVACHGSIRAGDTLGRPEMTVLLREMLEAEYPWVCCHGRPSIFRLATNQLDRLFWR